MEEVTQSFSESTIASAKAIVEDTIDAAFEIGVNEVPMELEIDIALSAVASRAAGGVKKYLTQLSTHTYCTCSVHTKAKNNLAPVWTEWEDTITESGMYNTISSVEGRVTIIPRSPAELAILSHTYDGTVLRHSEADWDTCHDATEGSTKDSTFGAQSILVYYPAGGYQIYRNFSYYDLSCVAGTIASARLDLTGTDVGGVGGVNTGTAVVKGTQTSIAEGGLVLGDYDSYDVGAYYGHIDSWDNTGLNSIALNSVGVAYIQSIIDADGIALLCVLEYDHDYLDVAPNALELFHNKMCAAEISETYPGNGPTLVLFY